MDEPGVVAGIVEGGEPAVVAAVPAVVAESVVEATPATLTPSQFAALKAALVEANPNVVAELISGDTVEAVLASATAAKTAYQRVATQVAEAATAGVLAGGGSREADLSAYEGLSPQGKIQLALSQRR